MFAIQSFSNLIENSNSYLNDTSKNLLNGFEIFHDLVECFKNEFGEIAQLEFAANSASPTDKVYTPISLRVSFGKRQSSDGLDFDHATRVLTTLTI
jgi:hypothetical protein